MPNDDLLVPTQPWILCLMRSLLLRSSLRPRLDCTSLTPFVGFNNTTDIHTHLCSRQIHYRYENARRDRVYGKRVPGAKVDTQELADRVSLFILYLPLLLPLLPSQS